MRGREARPPTVSGAMLNGAMVKYLNVRIYCAGVFLAGCVVIAGLAGSMDFRYLAQKPLTVAALFIGVMLGELMPVKIPRRGGDEEITLSISFSMALMSEDRTERQVA